MSDLQQSHGVLWGRLAWHPAVKAWLAFAEGAAEPDTIEVLRDGKQPATYRLVGVAPDGGSVIAWQESGRRAWHFHRESETRAGGGT